MVVVGDPEILLYRDMPQRFDVVRIVVPPLHRVRVNEPDDLGIREAHIPQRKSGYRNVIVIALPLRPLYPTQSTKGAAKQPGSAGIENCHCLSTRKNVPGGGCTPILWHTKLALSSTNLGFGSRATPRRN